MRSLGSLQQPRVGSPVTRAPSADFPGDPSFGRMGSPKTEGGTTLRAVRLAVTDPPGLIFEPLAPGIGRLTFARRGARRAMIYLRAGGCRGCVLGG